jgi:dCMP deaminase
MKSRDIKWIKACIECAKIFSTCGKKQYWCFIIDDHGYGRIVGQGYNGVPSGMKHCKDGGCPRFLNNVPSGTPYDHGPGLCYSSHAEVSALAHGDGFRYSNSTLYVNGEPCLTCAKSIAAAGIKRIVHLKEEDKVSSKDVRQFFNSASIQIIQISL